MKRSIDETEDNTSSTGTASDMAAPYLLVKVSKKTRSQPANHSPIRAHRN